MFNRKFPIPGSRRKAVGCLPCKLWFGEEKVAKGMFVQSLKCPQWSGKHWVFCVLFGCELLSLQWVWPISYIGTSLRTRPKMLLLWKLLTNCKQEQGKTFHSVFHNYTHIWEIIQMEKLNIFSCSMVEELAYIHSTNLKLLNSW